MSVVYNLPYILRIVMFISRMCEIITLVAFTVYYIKYRYLEPIPVAARP
jgi:hypothetical protein